MKKAIVITSIFNPTEAINKYAEKKGYTLIVVGDRKTPSNWNHINSIFLSVSEQEDSKFVLARKLPYNHYCRKMIGYLYAMQKNSDLIIDTDDDNIPKDNWNFPNFEGEFDMIMPDMGFINIYQLYTNDHIWPRGLPLKNIITNFNLENKIKKVNNVKVGIWQGLADEDPDVDAIYRLTNNKECVFNERSPIILGKGTFSPFNTQNTLICKELFPLMYLPTFVTFRYTDILRGLVAQPIMWLYDFQLGFTNATVIQKRNQHDYLKDFISEIPMYQTINMVVETVERVISTNKSIFDNLYTAYEALLEKNIVIKDELNTLEAWITDINNLKIFS